MMITHKPELSRLLSDLSKYNFKKLEKGEKVLLAKAISDTLPLPTEKLEDLNIYMLTHKNKILAILDAISHYLYINDKEVMYGLVKDFMYWRDRVAFNPPIVTFNSGADSIVDDLSCLNKFVDQSAMCDIVTVHANATYLYSVFRSVATLV